MEGVEVIFQERGGKKEAAKEEKATIDFAFASVVTIKEIEEGEELNDQNIWVKSPGTGQIKAKDFEKIIGKKATRFIPNDSQLTYDDFE